MSVSYECPKMHTLPCVVPPRTFTKCPVIYVTSPLHTASQSTTYPCWEAESLNKPTLAGHVPQHVYF